MPRLTGRTRRAFAARHAAAFIGAFCFEAISRACGSFDVARIRNRRLTDHYAPGRDATELRPAGARLARIARELCAKDAFSGRCNGNSGAVAARFVPVRKKFRKIHAEPLHICVQI